VLSKIRPNQLTKADNMKEQLIHITYKDQYGIYSYALEGFVDGDFVGFASASKDRIQNELAWYQDNFKGLPVTFTTITEELSNV